MIRKLSGDEKAGDGLDALGGAGLAEFESAEQVAGVGVGGVYAEVAEVGVHGGFRGRLRYYSHPHSLKP